MSRYFRFPFGVSGDKDEIPDPPVTGTGAVSYTEGYGPNYSLNPATEPSALNVERDMFNQLAFDITSTLQLYYQTGTPPFITSTDNGGTSFSYPRGSRVIFNDRIYESTTDGNTNTPAQSGWSLVDIQGYDARFTRRSLNLSDLSSAEDARDNLELGSVATLDAGTANSQIRNNQENDNQYYPQSEANITFLQRANNLDDVTSAQTARTNLGLGTAATEDIGTAQNHLPRNSDLGSASLVDTGTEAAEIRTNSQNDGRFLRQDQNLSDVNNAETARNNLNLGTAATLDEGTGSGDLMAVGAFGLGGNSELTGSNGNFNFDLTDTQTRFINSFTGTENAPSTRPVIGIYISRSSNNGHNPSKTQIVTNSDNNLFFRVMSSGVWQGWQQVLRSSQNLSEISNPVTARNNLQLGTVSILNSGTSDTNIRNNGQNNTHFYPRTLADTTFLQTSNNLSDVDEVQARNNLDLGTAATRNIGTSANQVMEVGAFGLGSFNTTFLSDADLDLENTQTAFYTTSGTTTGLPSTAAGGLINLGRGQTSNPINVQLYFASSQGLWLRGQDSSSTYGIWRKTLLNTSNLSDLSSAAIARTNLGLGTAATEDAGTAQNQIPRNSDLGSASLADTGTADTEIRTNSQNDDRFLRQSRNLDDVENAANARTNLGLRGAATRDIGTAQDRISLISNSGFGGHTIIDQDDGTQEFSSPDEINRNGMFYFSNSENDTAFPNAGDWFVFSMVSGSSDGDTDAGVKNQIAVGAGTKATENLFIRGQNSDNNTWSDWESIIAILPVFLNWGFGQFFANFMNGNFFPGMY